MADVNATVRVLDAVGRLQDATGGTEFEPLVDELLEAIAADTTVSELRQEIEFLKAENQGARRPAGLPADAMWSSYVGPVAETPE